MMNVLKHPSFFRPSSRPTSPSPGTAPPSRPDSGIGFSSRQHAKLSLSNFRRPSPAPEVAPITAPAPLVQDGSYLETLSLRLSEAVSKSLAQPPGPAPVTEQVAGKRPIPQGRGRALGALIASELRATAENPHLHRAILRSLHRPLSVLLNNLSAHLLPFISSPAFLSPPAPTVQAPNSNPTQLHALAIATFAGELLDTFDDLCLGMEADIRGDGLKLIREGLVSIITRVTGPLVAGIRAELMHLIESLETPNSIHAPKGAAGIKPSAHHPSIIALQAIMPVYARALTRYTTSTACQTTLASVLIGVIWKGLVALSHRPFVAMSPPGSPGLTPVVSKKQRASPTSTPPMTPQPGRFNIKLPPSRPPSPPSLYVPATAAADARALCELLAMLPRPTDSKEGARLASEAVEEAFNGLKALPPLLETVHAKFCLDSIVVEDTARELEVLTTELPLLVALPTLLHGYGLCSATTVAAILGLSEEEYRKGCLSGFGRAEECATAVAQRVYDAICADADPNGVVSRWLELEIADSTEAGV